MNITRDDATNRAVDNINDASQRIREGDYGAAGVHLDVALILVDMLGRMDAGAANMRITDITFGDGKQASYEQLQ